ncbi:hypothetical protein [Brevibacillus choshinensis]|uniref:hypothetical protein n=1 Tax=Brevibacillus choshinensis TaxID=54911 RepID=UPI002E1D1095|nr:hypothetical protein [Brevibacillus choshinensis]
MEQRLALFMSYFVLEFLARGGYCRAIGKGKAQYFEEKWKVSFVRAVRQVSGIMIVFSIIIIFLS